MRHIRTGGGLIRIAEDGIPGRRYLSIWRPRRATHPEGVLHVYLDHDGITWEDMAQIELSDPAIQELITALVTQS